MTNTKMAVNRSALYLISLVVFFLLGISASSTPDVGILQEACLGERFHAECPDGQVVVILSALFGRMHVGECARQDDIGCVADVLEYIDAQCSGKQRCDFLTLDENLYALNTCPPDSPPYLEAVYRCISVISNPDLLSQCQHSGIIVLSGIAQGLIASSIVHNSRQGSSVCPWVIEAEQGKRINITLMDFHYTHTDVSPAKCHIYATIIEYSSPSPTTVCSGPERQQVIYLSSSSRIEIQFIDSQLPESTPNFLLGFSVFGCGDPGLDGNVLKQINIQRATLLCKSTGQEQHIYCKGTTWQPLVEPCDESHWGLFPADLGSHQAIWIVLAMGIAIGIVIGLGLLLCGILCFKRFNKGRNRQNTESPYYRHTPNDDSKSFYALRKGEEPGGQMDYATYDRAATGPRHYMHVTSPVNRDVMLVGSGSIRRHGSIPPMDYDNSPIRYADQEEPAY